MQGRDEAAQAAAAKKVLVGEAVRKEAHAAAHAHARLAFGRPRAVEERFARVAAGDHRIAHHRGAGGGAGDETAAGEHAPRGVEGGRIAG